MSSRSPIISEESLTKIFKNEEEPAGDSKDKKKQRRGLMIQLFKCLKYYLYKRAGNRTPACKHDIT